MRVCQKVPKTDFKCQFFVTVIDNKEFDLKRSFVKNGSEYLFDLHIPNIKIFEFFRHICGHICPLLLCDMVFEKI